MADARPPALPIPLAVLASQAPPAAQQPVQLVQLPVCPDQPVPT